MVVVGFFLLAGLVLSLISLSEWCIETCAEAHEYRFFGYPFDLLGIVFFSIAIALWSLNFFSEGKTLYLLALLLSGAIGAEVWFILVQKLVIQSFCPVCLAIAGCIILASLCLLIEGTRLLSKSITPGDPIMLRQARRRSFPPFLTLITGFFIAFVGVFKPEQSFAQGTSEQEDPLFGNRSSPIEVYFVSDWFCKACKKLEPSLAEIVPSIMEKATVVFVDRAIHSESLNFLPYNLSFMLKEKGKYLELRGILTALTAKTKSPTQQDVQEAISPLGVTYKQLLFADIDSGMRFFQGIAQTFQINSTPTVIIANKKKIEAKKLVGLDEINRENILAWIERLK
jgi:uncharacterized membrane protein